MCRIISPTIYRCSSNFRKWTGGDGAGLTYSQTWWGFFYFLFFYFSHQNLDSQKVEREKPKNTSADLTSLRCHLSSVSSCSLLCLHVYIYIQNIRSTEILCAVSLTLYICLNIADNCTYQSPAVSFLTPPSQGGTRLPPLDGGSCGDLCPTLPGIRLVKGPIIIRIIWASRLCRRKSLRRSVPLHRTPYNNK